MTHPILSEVLPRPEQPFKGHIDRKAMDSQPDFPKEVQAPKGAPNILLIMTDDVGFGAVTTFGGPVPTPPDKPWLQYYAPGTSHAPHHAPKEWIAKFKGQFDQGWDKVREETFARQKQMGIVPSNTKLTPRHDSIPAWDSLDADHKKVYARMMEVYAAALSHAEYQMGCVLDAIEELGVLDNTLVIYIQGDNGASAEGTPQACSTKWPS